MYLRHTTVKKNGRHYTYWRLVRSVRQGKKVRQETVAYLGELDAQGRIDAEHLADSILGRRKQPSLFDDEPAPRGHPSRRAASSVEVDLQGVRIERGRQFGNVWLAWRLWQALELDALLEPLLPGGREEVPWAAMAAVLVIARLCEPSSELHIAENWYRRTALEDLLGVAPEKVNDDRLYRALDQLLPYKDRLETHLKDRLGTLFQLEYDLLLYDITSTYFEGQAARNPQAQRGYSRDHRGDCMQVCIGLVVTREGYPLGYEVFAGNRHDSTTLQEIVRRMEARYGAADRIWAVDRGMISEENVQWLKERGSRYIVGTPKSQLRSHEQQILAGEWSQVREGLEVKTYASTKGDNETFVLCRSEDRRQKERAIPGTRLRVRFEQRIEEGLQRIQASCEKRCHSVAVIERRVGRLLGKNSRGASLYDVRVTEAPAKSKPQKSNADQTKKNSKKTPRRCARLSWSRRANRSEWAEQSEGCYVLRTNIDDWSGEELWRAYIQLTDAEAAFRIQKHDLCLRPIWHQKEDRVQAHILVCFLAYALRKTLDGWSKRAGLGSSVPTLLEEFARIHSNDVVLPLRDGREIRLRCVVRPDRAQAILLDHLGLTLPDRLKIPKGCSQM